MLFLFNCDTSNFFRLTNLSTPTTPAVSAGLNQEPVYRLSQKMSTDSSKLKVISPRK